MPEIYTINDITYQKFGIESVTGRIHHLLLYEMDMNNEYVEAKKKWSPLCRRHF